MLATIILDDGDIITIVLSLLCLALAYCIVNRHARDADAQLEEVVRRQLDAHTTRPGTRAVFLTRQGLVCPLCRTSYPHPDSELHVGRRSSWLDHVMHDHADSDLAADVRYLVTSGVWKPKNMN